MNKCKCCIFKELDYCLLDCDTDGDFCDDFELRELYHDECSIEAEIMADMIAESVKELSEGLING